MTNKIKEVLEKRFKSLHDLQLSTNDKRNKIKYNPLIRDYYTNKSVNERYQIHNGNCAPPLLLRQYNNSADKTDVDILESQNNIQTEFVKQTIKLCTFTRDEIKYIIEMSPVNLTIDKDCGIFQIFCDIDSVIHTLKYFGSSILDNRMFFFTRFIIEDNIIPVFEDSIFNNLVHPQQVFLDDKNDLILNI